MRRELVPRWQALALHPAATAVIMGASPAALRNRAVAEAQVTVGPASTQKFPLAAEHAVANVVPDFTPTSTLAKPVVVPAL
jgi:hypothetical protein